MDNNAQEYYTIDLVQIFKALWRRAWAIVLAGLIAAGVAFGFAAFVVTPTYSSSVLLYVNNKATMGGSNISSSDIVASQNLVKTYGEILNNRTTLEKVIEKAEVNYSYKELSKMIVSKSSNNTEIMKVTVTTDNPYVSARIANCIAEILPERIEDIIEGTSMKVVENAIPVLEKVAPSITKYTAVGLIIGVLIAVIIIVVYAMLDDTIHDEEYILKTYEYPVLAKIPNLTTPVGKHGYYYQSKKD